MRTTTLAILVSIMQLFSTPTAVQAILASHAHSLLPAAESDEFHLFLGLSSFLENGDMTYTIQGPEDGGWKSSLEWPLKNIMYVGGLTSFRFGTRVQASAGIWTSVTDDSGTMKDSDWLYRDYDSERAIYSESDTTVHSNQFDVNIRYDVWQTDRNSLGAILGYAFTRWEWEAGNGYQWSVDTSRFYQGFISGLGIIYTQKITVPYIGAAFSFNTLERLFGVNAYALYSSLAACDDEDDHILRYKLSTGNTDGSFFSFGGDVRWNMTDHFTVNGHLAQTRYHLEGKQQQYFYAGTNAGYGTNGIDLTIEGRQTYIGVTVGYEF